jgi:fibronectin-binding autotransporter adhesin
MKPNPKNHLARLILSTIAAPVALVFTASRTHAVTNYSGLVDDWADETNWTPNVVPDGPAGAFNQRLNFNGGTTVTFGVAQGTVELGGPSGDARAFAMGNVNPNASTGTATLNITGGIMRAAATATAASNAASLVAANGAGSTAILNVSGGILDLTTAGTAPPRILSIGLGGNSNAGISGTVNLSGSGLIKVSEFRINETGAVGVGGSITGVLNLNGGTLETSAVRESGSGNVTSTVNLNGGLLKLTGSTGISSTLDTVNVLSGANIEVVTGITAASGKDLLAVGLGGLTKTGDGTLTLTNASTYAGDTAISAGSLSAGQIVVSGGSSSLGNAASAVTLGSAGSQGTLSYTGATATYTRGFTIGGAGGGRLDVTPAATTLTIDTGAITGSGLFTVGGTGIKIINAAITHSGGLTKTASSGSIFLNNGSNSYSGETNITGVLIVTANNALGTTAGGTTVNASSTLGLSSLTSLDFTSLETVTGSGIGSGAIAGVTPATSRGFVQSTVGNNTFRGDIVVNAGGVSRIGTQDGASLTLTGTITQATGNMLFRAGSGPLLPTPNTGGDFVTLSNAGSSFGADSVIFTGASTGYSGVRLGITNALPSGLTISGLGGGTPTAAGTALDLNGFDQTLNGLTGAATLNIINTNIGTPSTLTLNPTADQTTSGTVIVGGTGLTGPLGTINLIKEGTFIQTLAGANTYTGTTAVNDGTLLINGNSGGATGAVSVNNTSTLGGSGTLGGNVTVAAAANLAPGASAGTLTITGNLDLSAMAGGAGQLKYELDALAGTNDLIAVGGSLNLGTLALDDLAVTNLGGLEAGTYTLITSTGLSGTVDGTTALISAGFNGKLQTNVNNLELVVTAVGGGSAYDTWKAANAPVSNPDDDTDGDGVTNAVEFVLGGTSLTKDLEKLPEVSTSGGNMTVTFERAIDSIDPKTALFIETSTDLVTWNTAPSPYTVPDVAIVGPPVTVVEDSPAGFDTVTLTVPQAPDAKKFARLKVVITP